MKRPMVAPFDLVTSLLACFVALVLLQTQHRPPAIETLGQYAVVITWPDGSNDDVDLYVRDPAGKIVYFNNRDAGTMHLEHDDRGTLTSRARQNEERVILRGVDAGEYVVNVHLYRKVDRGSTPVTVELWRLRGSDKLVYSKRVVLERQGQQITAFRFVRERITGDLPYDMVDRATAGP